MIDAYNRDGELLTNATALDIGKLMTNNNVKKSRTWNGYVISTVHLVIDHGHGISEKPLIFETMIFPGEEQLRYSTVSEALCGHRRMYRKYSLMIPAFLYKRWKKNI